MTSQQPSRIFWVEKGKTLSPLTADEILIQFEDGELSADTPLRIQQDSAPRPLARYIRELVWLAHQRHSDKNPEEADRTLFQAAFDRAPIGVVLSDLAGRLQHANPIFCELLGYSLEEICGLDVGKLSEPGDREKETALGNELLAGKRSNYHIEKTFRTKAGEHIETYTAISIVRDENGSPQHVIAHIMDLTPLKELEQSKQASEAENQAKTAFLSRMSHEIRTPMNAILGYVQLLRRESNLSERQVEYLGTIWQSGEHLLSLINDVLDMAKIEAGHTSTQRTDVDFQKLLLDLERMFRLPSTKKGLSFSITRATNLPRILRTDPIKLRQILINLIGNAIKFTKKGGIEITVNVTSHSDNTLGIRVEVADTGCGVEPESLDHIFTPFHQATAGKTKLGTGLGLAVSREFAQLLGGNIIAKSTLGVGSVFRFDFVATSTQLENNLPHHEVVVGCVPGTRPRHVLIADDNSENRLVLERILEQVGFLVRSRPDGLSALKSLKDQDTDLLLLDLKMPKMNGIQVIQHIRSQPEGDKLAIIVVSASVLDSEREASLKAGANAFLSKPIREKILFDTISTLIGIKYRYSGETDNTEPEETPTLTLELPDELLTALHKATLAGDMTMIESLVKKVTDHAPGLGERMGELSHAFDYETLLTLIETVPTAEIRR